MPRNKKSHRRGTDDATFGKFFLGVCLADASARKATVILDAHLTAAEKVRDSRDGFFSALRAGADRKYEVSEGKLLTAWLENLGVLFHRIAPFGEQFGCHQRVSPRFIGRERSYPVHRVCTADGGMTQVLSY